MIVATTACMPTLTQDLFYEEIGRRIKDARDKANISQETLATALGLTRASVINIEKGRHKPSLYLLLEIADILMVSLINLIPLNESGTKHLKKIIKVNLNSTITDGQEKIDKNTKASVLKFLESLQNH